MELSEKIKVNGVEVECKVDTGADFLYLSKDVIKKAGLKPLKKIKVKYANGFEDEKDVFLEDIEIAGCKVPAVVIVEGHHNLLGHNVLQRLGAVIDEQKGEIKYRVCPSPTAHIG